MRPQLFSSVFLEISYFLLPIHVFFYFLLPMHRYGELVASHPWKAIIACLAITIAGGSGLLRSILEKSNIEYWRNMEEILMTLVWTSQGNIGRKNQLKNKPIIHFFVKVLWRRRRSQPGHTKRIGIQKKYRLAGWKFSKRGKNISNTCYAHLCYLP